MRYVVYGAGGVGGVIGARLAQHGRDVVLIARGRHLEAIRARGLTLKTPVDALTVPIAAVAEPRDLRFTPDDLVLLTMRTQDATAALDELRAAAGTEAPVVCAQNGVENERLALRRFTHVYGMVVLFPASFTEPGEILNYASDGGGLLVTGRYPEGVDATVEQLTFDLVASGFRAEAEPEIRRWKYAKLVRNLGAAFAGVFGRDADTAALRAALEAEAWACYRAAGIDAPTKEEETRRGRAPGFEFGQIEGYPPFASSVWQGLMRGNRSSETDYINGEIALLGALHAVPTPYNRALQQTAVRCMREGIAPGTVKVEEVVALARSLGAE